MVELQTSTNNVEDFNSFNQENLILKMSLSTFNKIKIDQKNK